MAAYDGDRRTVEWFERVLGSPVAEIRRRALELLSRSDGPRRDGWLARAADDEDADVRATAVLVGAAIAARSEIPGEDLLESDFGQGAADDDLEWEWEYCFVPCAGVHVPTTGLLVWTAQEDDEGARAIAAMKASAGSLRQEEVVPVMIDKRLVTRYTRSPRSHVEAMQWNRNGRPRYREPGDGRDCR